MNMKVGNFVLDQFVALAVGLCAQQNARIANLAWLLWLASNAFNKKEAGTLYVDRHNTQFLLMFIYTNILYVYTSLHHLSTEILSRNNCVLKENHETFG